MLARLISVNQVVLLCLSTQLFLFFDGKVYTRGDLNLWHLPKHSRGQSMWTLADMDSEQQGPHFNKAHRIWPIQASSPDPNRWKTWIKQFGAGMLGMPLWNMEELMKGYVISCFLPGHVVWQGKLVTDCSRPLQFTS
jgi:hypothetical protein